MSCRIIGMDVELAMLREVCGNLRAHAPFPISAGVQLTDANEIARDLFLRAGFSKVDAEWWLDPGVEISPTPHVELA